MLKFGKIALLLMILLPSSVYSNWSRPYRKDDGGRIYISAKIGGVGVLASKMENELGKDFTSNFYVLEPTTDNFILVSEEVKLDKLDTVTVVSGPTPLNLGESKPQEKLKSFTFYSSLALGFVIPEYQNWRTEFSWDHVAQFNYDPSPIFEQKYNYVDLNNILHEFDVPSGAMTTTNTIDLYMLNFYYDFYDSRIKRAGEWIPYIGFGIGYANIITKMQLDDLYGDFSMNSAISSYGYASTDADTPNLTLFYESELQKGSLALAGMLGFSFGFTDSVFLDLGLKVSWIDKIHWALTNTSTTTTTGSKNIIGSSSNFLTSGHVGLRLEF